MNVIAVNCAFNKQWHPKEIGTIFPKGVHPPYMRVEETTRNGYIHLYYMHRKDDMTHSTELVIRVRVSRAKKLRGTYPDDYALLVTDVTRHEALVDCEFDRGGATQFEAYSVAFPETYTAICRAAKDLGYEVIMSPVNNKI